ncbi:MAG: hypothetical protein ACJ8MR_15025 [Povalibacter sp.]
MKIAICALLLLASTAVSADDFKVIKLEQDVRNLEREVQELSRQLADLQQRTARDGIRVPESVPRKDGVQPTGTAWLSAEHWKQIRTGMSELEVISLLGPPTSLRGPADSGERTLMYAMEIGSSGFLSGSVRLEQRKVAEVQLPTLK